ncbi:hypothetical protein DK28_0205470 [Peptococcaceae bacterium SCADC1_2_3]|jgi:hypothetical protein|nr:hypothetical protein DK28_0205470 [Peptococcaceae bacterium SCADC1_2_3]KFI36195.1 hypothetical protein HY00_06165 [Peptococcaceae bacterium SCADC1_2_3]HBQ28100.1 hypothetical protein [Desulfotomaculum sp.]HCJ78440.1 hypothetical protein [Desulfotomaculum sp.]
MYGCCNLDLWTAEKVKEICRVIGMSYGESLTQKVSARAVAVLAVESLNILQEDDVYALFDFLLTQVQDRKEYAKAEELTEKEISASWLVTGLINILRDTGLADQKDFSFLFNGGEKNTYAAWQKIGFFKKELLAYFKPETSLAQDKFMLVKPFFEQALRFINFEAQDFRP